MHSCFVCTLTHSLSILFSIPLLPPHLLHLPPCSSYQSNPWRDTRRAILWSHSPGAWGGRVEEWLLVIDGNLCVIVGMILLRIAGTCVYWGEVSCSSCEVCPKHFYGYTHLHPLTLPCSLSLSLRSPSGWVGLLLRVIWRDQWALIASVTPTGMLMVRKCTRGVENHMERLMVCIVYLNAYTVMCIWMCVLTYHCNCKKYGSIMKSPNFFFPRTWGRCWVLH
jgi:hypothetical protein